MAKGVREIVAVKAEDYLGLPDAWRRVFFVLAFSGRDLQTEKGAVEMLCGGARGITEAYASIKQGGVCGVSQGNGTFRGRLTPECARAMAEEACREGWYDIETEVKGERDVLMLWARNPGKARPGAVVAASWAFKMMAVAPGKVEPNRALKSLDDKEERMAAGVLAADWLGRHLTEVPQFGEGLHRHFLQTAMQEWLGVAFLNGLDARPALEAVRAGIRAGVRMPEQLWPTYFSTCMWTGRIDLLAEMKGVKLPKKAEAFLTGCARMLQRDFKSASDLFDESGVFDGRNLARPKEIRRMPARLLMHVALTEYPKGKKRRLADLWKMYGMMKDAWWSPWCDMLMVEGEASVETWRLYWPEVKKGVGTYLGEWDTRDRYVPMMMLAAWDYGALQIPRGKFAQELDVLAEEMERLAEAGYAGLAALMRTLLAGVARADAAAGISEAARAAGVEFVAYREAEPEWKMALNVLENRLLLNNGTKKAGAAELCWAVLGKETDDGMVKITAVEPGKIVGGNMILYRWPKGREWVTAMGGGMKDISVWRAMKTHYDTYWHENYTFADVVCALCGMDNVVAGIDLNGKITEDRELVELGMGIGLGCVRVKLKAERLPLEMVRGEDGSYTFAAPKWTSRFAGGEERLLARRTGDAEITVYRPDPVELGVVEFLRENSKGGKFRLPAEAGERGAAVAAALEKRMAVARPSRAAGKELPRVKSEGKLSLRLTYDTGALTVEAVVKPLAGRPDFALRAATGEAETYIEGKKGPYLLERNAEEELKDAERVAAALPEDAEGGLGMWTVVGVAESLETLGGLKELDPPVEMEWRGSAGIKVSHAPKSGVALTAGKTAEEWFSVSGTFTLDDGRAIGVAEMLAAMATRSGSYVKLSEGDWVKLTEGMAKELDALAAVGRKTGGGEVAVSRAALPMLEKEMSGRDGGMGMPAALAAGAKEIRKALGAKHEVPAGVTAEMRPYQEDGYEWLARLSECGLGACLADDMGLGKTLQVIALLLKRAEKGASLVLAPASVCPNWAAEMRKFAPGLKPVMAMDLEEGALAGLGAGEVAISSYGYMLFHEEEMAGREWNVLALDEAQAVKNAAAKRAKAVKRLRAGCRVAATGTPVENNLGELWSLFDFLNPGMLGSATTFAARFMEDGRAGTRLKKLVKPFILRRLKGDVLKDLPERTEVTIPVELGKAERSAYEGCRLHALEMLANAGDGAKARFSILAELTRLRRFCCHPSLVLGAESSVPSAKMEAVVDLLESLHQGGHKALLFSQFTDYLELVERMVKAHGWTSLYLDGSTPVKERERLVERFQGGEAEFFLISLKAGGTGLNLTAANYVLLLDPWWNPAVENQAADRAHRIGQKNPVTVYRLVAKGTVEEKVTELHGEKKALAADMLDGTGSTALSPKELLGLFGAK